MRRSRAASSIARGWGSTYREQPARVLPCGYPRDGRAIDSMLGDQLERRVGDLLPPFFSYQLCTFAYFVHPFSTGRFCLKYLRDNASST